MEIYKKYFSKYNSELVLISILFLFFFQLITDFVESIYALNLIEVEINENVAAVLFLLTPIVLFFFKKGISDKLMVIVGEIMIMCRVLYPFFDVQIKMIITGIGVGSFMIFFPVFLQKKSLENEETSSLLLGMGLSMGVALSILFKTLGSSIDLSLLFWYQWIGWILAVISGIMMIEFLKLNRLEEGKTAISNSTSNNPIKAIRLGSKWKILGLSLGIIGIICLIYFAFSSPTVISRWSEGNYITIITILILMITIFMLIATFKPDLISKITPKGILIWNCLFIFSLFLTIAIHQIPFALITSYPTYAPETTIFHQIPLYLMLFLSPIILIDFTLLTKELFKSKPSSRKIGVSFFISAGFFLLMVFSTVFTSVYEYVPYIGSLFRDMIWLVFLIIGIITAAPILLVNKESFSFAKVKRYAQTTKLKIAGIIGIIALGTILGGILLEFPSKQTISAGSITALSYNIQQGTDENGNKNFEGQFDVIKTLHPDIIGLQESDTCRISGGNSDFVRYTSSRLRYYTYFGPKTVTGTYGIALLSKYPILNPRTFYMESKGEQTATIWAQIEVDGTIYNIFVTHLGNYVDPAEDRSQIVQQENILSVTSGLSNVILMGDFNFEPNTEQYNITVAAQLYDCWELVYNYSPLSALIENVPKSWVPRLPEERIDHVFVSNHLNNSISNIVYTGGGNSDHPAVFARITT